MLFFKSIFSGSEITYNYFNLVTFCVERNKRYRAEDEANKKKITDLRSKLGVIFNFALSFPHQMSHAIACKVITNKPATLVFKLDDSAIFPRYPGALEYQPNWKQTIVHLAGPAGGMAFYTITWIAAAALKNYIGWPIVLALKSFSIFVMSIDLLGIITAGGDAVNIKNIGKTHLTAARVFLTTQYILGILLALKLSQ